jgi:hypothetical protein
MAVLSFPYVVARPRMALFNSSRAPAFKTLALKKPFADYRLLT